MIGRKDTTNYYEMLEVRADAPQTEIYRAYQRAKSTYSPENPALYSMFTPDEARELLKVIEEAYSVLSNATLRKNYDDSLSTNRSGIEANIAHFIQQTNSPDNVQSNVQANDQSNAPSNGEPVKSNYSQNTKTELTNPSKFQTVEMTDDYIIRRKDAGSTLPEGFGKTSLSTYKIDAAKEEQIAKIENMDGAFLKIVREYKNLSIERISDATRISRTYLHAVEANDYRELPAPVFVRGFIVQFARLLNLDETKVANSYLQIYKTNKK